MPILIKKIDVSHTHPTLLSKLWHCSQNRPEIESEPIKNDWYISRKLAFTLRFEDGFYRQLFKKLKLYQKLTQEYSNYGKWHLSWTRVWLGLRFANRGRNRESPRVRSEKCNEF